MAGGVQLAADQEGVQWAANKGHLYCAAWALERGKALEELLLVGVSFRVLEEEATEEAWERMAAFHLPQDLTWFQGAGETIRTVDLPALAATKEVA